MMSFEAGSQWLSCLQNDYQQPTVHLIKARNVMMKNIQTSILNLG